ncbi:MAG: hypothetical protein ACREM2_06165 [Vulcanimicrobiaceae bacterium]
MPAEPNDFATRCAQAAALAERAGLVLEKSATAHELVVRSGDATVSFPIVTDDRDWSATTPQQAFFAALLDARAWSTASLANETAAPSGTAPDALARLAADQMRRDYDDQTGRLKTLAAMLVGVGGLDALWDAAGLSAAAATSGSGSATA